MKTTKVLGIVGARMSSSRLPGKHFLDLSGKPLIARVFERLEKVPEITDLYLATTSEDINEPLIEWAKDNNKSIYAYEGDTSDLVGRINNLAKLISPDILVYVCGDSPLIEPGSISLMLQALISNVEADFVSISCENSVLKTIHEGFYPYRLSVWNKLEAVSITEEEREHVGLANNKIFPSLQGVQVVDNEIYCQLEHRLSVDTISDYHFMSEIYRRWYKTQPDDDIVSLSWVINELKSDKKLRLINSHVQQREAKLSYNNILIVYGIENNIDSYTTLCGDLAQVLQDTISAGVFILTKAGFINETQLRLFPHLLISERDDYLDVVTNYILSDTTYDTVLIIVDEVNHERFLPYSENINSQGITSYIVSIPTTPDTKQNESICAHSRSDKNSLIAGIVDLIKKN